MAPFKPRWSSARELVAAYRAKRAEGGLRGLLGAPFTPKPWQNFPATTTPITAEALIDLETRLATYTELEDKAEAERAEKAEGERLKVAANLSDLTSASTARTNLGLGTAATQPSSAFDASGAAAAAQAAAIAASVPLASKGAALGVPPLDASALIPSAFLPPLALTDPYVVHSEAEQLALSAHLGDFAIRTDIGKTFVHNTGSSGTIADWTELITPGDVVSVNGHVGVVSLAAADVAAIPTSEETKIAMGASATDRQVPHWNLAKGRHIYKDPFQFDPRDFAESFDTAGENDVRAAVDACVKEACAFIGATGKGAVVQLPAGILFFNSGAPSEDRPSSFSATTTLGVPIPVNLPAQLTIRGMGENATTIKLSENAQCAFYPHKIADYDVVQNIRFEDLALNNNGSHGLGHSLFGTVDPLQQKLLRLSFQNVTGARMRTYGYTFDETATLCNKGFVQLQGKHLANNEATQTFTKDVTFEDITMEECQQGLLVQCSVPIVHNHFYDRVFFRRCKHVHPKLPIKTLAQTSYYICGSGFGNYCAIEDCYSAGTGDDAVEIGAMQTIEIDRLRVQDAFIAGITFRLTHPLSEPHAQTITLNDCTFTATEALKLVGEEANAINPTTRPSNHIFLYISDEEGGTFGSFELNNVKYKASNLTFTSVDKSVGRFGFETAVACRQFKMTDCGVVLTNYEYNSAGESELDFVRSGLGSNGTWEPNFRCKGFSVIVNGLTDSGAGAGKLLMRAVTAGGEGSVSFEDTTMEVGNVVVGGTGLRLRFANFGEGGEPNVIKLRGFKGHFDSTTSSGSIARRGINCESASNFGKAYIEDNDFRAPWRSSTAEPDLVVPSARRAQVIERNNLSSFDNGYERIEANYTMTSKVRLVGVKKLSAEVTATLPELVTVQPSVPGDAPITYTIADETNSAGGSHHIKIACGGADTFADGTTSKTIGVNGGSLSFYSDGEKWVQAGKGESPFVPSLMLLPATIETYDEPTTSAKESRKALQESFSRLLCNKTLVLTSGTPICAAIPVAANTVIRGVGFDVKTTEGTAADRTHLWVALINEAGELVATSLDYTSSEHNPLLGGMEGFKFVTPYEALKNEVVRAIVCETMSATNPISLAAVEGSASVNEKQPVLGGTYPAGQTTPELFTVHTLTPVAEIPYMVLV